MRINQASQIWFGQASHCNCVLQNHQLTFSCKDLRLQEELLRLMGTVIIVFKINNKLFKKLLHSLDFHSTV